MSQYPFVTTELNFVPAGIRSPEARYLGDAGEAVRNYDPEPRSVQVINGRLQEDRYTLDESGFEFVIRPTALDPVTVDDDPRIRDIYYPEVLDTLKSATGADEIVIFDHTIRIAANAAGRHPVLNAHNDYTESSAPKRLAELIGQAEADRWFRSRVIQVNLWRPLAGPVEALPLALLDARSLGPTDLRETALIFPHRTGQIYHVSHSTRQRWTYFPDMVPSEAILIKGYDSARDGRARFTPHSAFVDPNTPRNAARRHSIEVRAFLRLAE